MTSVTAIENIVPQSEQRSKVRRFTRVVVVPGGRGLWEQQHLQSDLRRREGWRRWRDRQMRHAMDVRGINWKWTKKERKKEGNECGGNGWMEETSAHWESRRRTNSKTLPWCLLHSGADSAEPALCCCPLLVDNWNYTWTTASPLATHTHTHSNNS